MTEEKLTRKIKIVNYILIGLIMMILVYVLIEAKKSHDVGALAAIPFTFIGCGFLSVLMFELVDLIINRGFYQIKAYINSVIMIILAISLIFMNVVFGIVFLCLSIYHGLLARQDFKLDHPAVNVKNAILTTTGMILSIPVLSFLAFVFLGWV